MDSWRTLVTYMESRDTTSADDLRRLSNAYFVPGNRAWGFVRPATTSRAISREQTSYPTRH